MYIYVYINIFRIDQYLYLYIYIYIQQRSEAAHPATAPISKVAKKQINEVIVQQEDAGTKQKSNNINIAGAENAKIDGRKFIKNPSKIHQKTIKNR